jgi:hypothetical protein
MNEVYDEGVGGGGKKNLVVKVKERKKKDGRETVGPKQRVLNDL